MNQTHPLTTTTFELPGYRAMKSFGVVRGIIVLLALTVVVDMTPMKSAPMWQESMGAHIASVALTGLKPVLPQEFGKYLPS